MNIALVGEAWGREEEEAGAPFVGPSGRFLNALLAQVGIHRSDCYVTNVFNFRPKPSNDIRNLCGPKSDGIPGMPSVVQGKYILAKYKPELDRLYKELKDVKPNLIVALGGTAAWAILRTSGVKKVRGTTLASPFGKALVTYHPAAVLRDWALRTVLLADLIKCAREGKFAEIRRPLREVWIEPTIPDLYEFERRYIEPSPALSIDIETVGDQITCIGFAPTVDRAIVVPFFDRSRPDRNYWSSHRDEVEAWRWVKHICGLRKRIVGQNLIYDMHRLLRNYGITVPSMEDDTMLLSHALYPELEKGLSFLGSIHSDERAWKQDYQNETLKRED